MKNNLNRLKILIIKDISLYKIFQNYFNDNILLFYDNIINKS